MPTIALTDFNIICATLGGFISLFGLVSYLLKEHFYLSEPLISLLAGVTFSPHALDWVRPLQYAQGIPENVDHITLYFSRLVLGVQLVIAGIQLPSRYLKTEWRSLTILLGPGMTAMWIVSAMLVWAMVPHIPFVHALAVAACVTPTDPVLSNSIVKGKFADKNIPRPLQKIIIAESGANDGLGYPFLFLALYIIKYNDHDGYAGAGEAMREWFGETWGYTILLSVVYGIVVGWVAKDLLHFCERKKYVDRESFLVFAIAMALFIVGTVGMIGSDDVLACFIAGNVFTWDDWFRKETEDDSLQPTIDMLLNISVFAWYGAVCPWPSFRTNEYIPIYRLIFLGVLILLLRRLPMVLAVHKGLHQIQGWQQAAYVGFFGPIGVSAIFYLYISEDFLLQVTVNGEVRPDCEHLAGVIRVVVWFLAICSIVVHGLSVPLGKLSYHFPRTISRAISTESEQPPASATERVKRFSSHLKFHAKRRAKQDGSVTETEKATTSPYKLEDLHPARTVIPEEARDPGDDSDNLEPPRPVNIIESPSASQVHFAPQGPSPSTSQVRFAAPGPSPSTSQVRFAQPPSTRREGPSSSGKLHARGVKEEDGYSQNV